MSDRLTPIDILNARLRHGLGYSRKDVDDLLRRVAAEMETLIVELAAGKQKSSGTERENVRFRELEQTMRDALVLALQAADETRSAARASADLILRDATARARSIESEAQKQASSFAAEVETLRLAKSELAADLRAKLTAQLAWLDRLESSFELGVLTRPAQPGSDAAMEITSSNNADRPELSILTIGTDSDHGAEDRYNQDRGAKDRGDLDRGAEERG